MNLAPSGSAVEGFQPALYPRRYAPSRTWTLVLAGVGAVGLVPAIFGCSYVAAGHWLPGGLGHWALCAMLCLMVAGSAYLLAAGIWGYRIRLTASTIEFREVFRRRILRRDQIAAWRVAIEEGRRFIELTPQSSATATFRLGLLFAPDSAFFSWFSGLGCTDGTNSSGPAQHRRSDDVALVWAKRLLAGARARRSARLALPPFLAANLWILCGREPYPLLVAALLALPWLVLALVWLSRGRYGLNSGASPAGFADLSSYFLLPMPVLTLWVLRDWSVPDWPLAIAPGIAVGVLLTAAATVLAPAFCERLGQCALILAAASAYGTSLIIVANAILDPSPTAIYPATVVSRDRAGGVIPEYRLLLRRQGANTEVETVRVGRHLFGGAVLGGEVCLEEHAGAFGLHFGQVRTCVARAPGAHPASAVPPPETSRLRKSAASTV
jgi:hypothetical protein